MNYRRLSLPDYILANSMPIPFAGCWIWMRGRIYSGYGTISINSKKTLVHRVSWTVFRSPIPDGMHVLHSCDVRSCVNPDHLWLGTHADNMRDRKAKGGYSRAARAA